MREEPLAHRLDVARLDIAVVASERTGVASPMKLLEYMALGRPVLTTRLPGIPDDYADKLLFADDSVEGLAAAISDAFRMPPTEREGIAAAARRFVLSEKCARHQGARISAFLRQLTQSAE